MSYTGILDFWFSESSQPFWFKKDDAFDTKIREHFLSHYQQARDGELDSWAGNPHSRLALILLLDQCPRNLFRNSPEAFATDHKAQTLTLEGIGFGHDMELSSNFERMFFYLPLEHAENRTLQQKSVEKITENINDPELIKYAQQHKEVIDQFGRFPHRNNVLGRESSAEEIRYLAEGGHSF